MGDDAVVMATESEVTSRWNIGTTGSVHDSKDTEDIGVMIETAVVRIHQLTTFIIVWNLKSKRSISG